MGLVALFMGASGVGGAPLWTFSALCVVSGAILVFAPDRIALSLLVGIAILDLLPLAYMIGLSSWGGVGEAGTGSPVLGGPWRRLMASAPLFPRWLFNSAAVAILTVGFHLVADAMAAYVLAKRKFRGRRMVFALILIAMMVPRQVTLIPLFLGMGRAGLADTFAGLLLPGFGDVIGIFLLRQYMVTLPDHLLEAAQIDGAGQWAIFGRIVVPLSIPALAVLAVLSFQHYWSDFFWPLVITHSESNFTLQVGLAYLVQSEFGPDIGLLAAGACAAALPMLLVFYIFRSAFFEGFRGGALK